MHQNQIRRGRQRPGAWKEDDVYGNERWEKGGEIVRAATMNHGGEQTKVIKWQTTTGRAEMEEIPCQAIIRLTILENLIRLFLYRFNHCVRVFETSSSFHKEGGNEESELGLSVLIRYRLIYNVPDE